MFDIKIDIVISPYNNLDQRGRRVFINRKTFAWLDFPLLFRNWYCA